MMHIFLKRLFSISNHDLLYEKFWSGKQRELIVCVVVDRLLRNAIEIRPY
jgi:hypothetical protein